LNDSRLLNIFKLNVYISSHLECPTIASISIVSWSSGSW